MVGNVFCYPGVKNMRLNLSAIVLLAAIVCFAVPLTPAVAQDSGGGTVGNPHDVRNSVKAGALSARAPGNWIKTAISGGREITEPPSEEPGLRKTMILAAIDALFQMLDQLILSLQAAVALQQTATTTLTP